MIEHPCKDGFSPSCFKAYPVWVTKALAYKLLHALLPKEVMPILKVGLDVPLIGPGSTLPTGVDLPSGSIIPPDLIVPENWIAWFNFIFMTVDDPRTLFPIDWKPGDSFPVEIKITEGFVLPPSWTPKDPPHPAFLPGYLPFHISPEDGAAPPLHVGVSEPGPVHRPTPAPPVGWNQILNDASWQSPNYGIGINPMMTWDGTKWLVVTGGSTECYNWPQLNPKSGTTWALNFRPAQARVTFTGGTAPIKIGFCDAPGNLIAHNLNSVSPQLFDLDFSAGNDIYFFDTTNIGMYITNIEFK